MKPLMLQELLRWLCGAYGVSINSTLEGEVMALLEAIHEASFKDGPTLSLKVIPKLWWMLYKLMTWAYWNRAILLCLSSLCYIICNSNFDINFTKRQSNMVTQILTRAIISCSLVASSLIISLFVLNLILLIKWVDCICSKSKTYLIYYYFLTT
jgi:hypothetical protein